MRILCGGKSRDFIEQKLRQPEEKVSQGVDKIYENSKDKRQAACQLAYLQAGRFFIILDIHGENLLHLETSLSEPGGQTIMTKS